MSGDMTNEQLIENFELAGTFSEQKQVLLLLVESEDPGTLFQVRNLILDLRDLNLLRLGGMSSLRKWGEETFFDLKFKSLGFTQKLNYLRIGCLADCRDEILIQGLEDEDQGVRHETARMIERLSEPPGRKVFNMMRTVALNMPEKNVLIALVQALAAHPSGANIEILKRISSEYSNIPEVIQAVVRAEKRMMEYQRIGTRFCRWFPMLKGIHDLLYRTLDNILKPRNTHVLPRSQLVVIGLILTSLLVSGLTFYGVTRLEARRTEWSAASHHCTICGMIQTPASMDPRGCIACGEDLIEMDERTLVALRAGIWIE